MKNCFATTYRASLLTISRKVKTVLPRQGVTYFLTFVVYCLCILGSKNTHLISPVSHRFTINKKYFSGKPSKLLTRAHGALIQRHT